MSLYSRFTNLFRRSQIDQNFDDEIQAHIEEAIANGRSPEDARRALGNRLRHREQSRDIRMIPWLDALASDVTFGLRQLRKNKVASAAAILSLGLAIGACTAAFRLIDSILLRPLPIAGAERLHTLAVKIQTRDGKTFDVSLLNFPLYQRLKEATKDSADVYAITVPNKGELTYGSDQEMEKVAVQLVSGNTLPSFGLQPALGRILTPSDDVHPGKHPYAVLSHSYWQRRFGQDPNILGKTFRWGNNQIEIIGVLREGFTGTEPGTFTDIFIPTMMNSHAAITNPFAHWHRIWVRPHAGITTKVVEEQIESAYSQFRREMIPAEVRQASVDQTRLVSSASGESTTKRVYREALIVLTCIALLVLLIACTNIANLMTAQAISRSREMALRVSIGAGKFRLIQMVLVESALLAVLASLVGIFFAAWSIPLVVSMISNPDDPLQLHLDSDWRLLAFSLVLTSVVTFLFGLIPALRASEVQPASALKGGDQPHVKLRLMGTLVTVQVAFCVLVHFTSSLFVSSSQKLINQPLGFIPDGVVVATVQTRQINPTAQQSQEMKDHLLSVPGVQSVALSNWPLMGSSIVWEGIGIPGQQTTESSDNRASFLGVSPDFLTTMGIHLISGRTFRPEEATNANVAIVNEEFSRHFFNHENPVGRTFTTSSNKDSIQIVGYMKDSRYSDLHSPVEPTFYRPLSAFTNPISAGSVTVLIKTKELNIGLISSLRHEISRAQPKFRVTNLTTQTQLVRNTTVRERVIATLSLFFSGVSLILTAIGLYGILHYSILQRRREIGIRMALGARGWHIVRGVVTALLVLISFGLVLGLGGGLISHRYFEALLFGVKPTELTMLLIPTGIILGVAIFAALPPLIKAIQIDPVETLRSE